VQQLRTLGALVERTVPALWGEVTKQPSPRFIKLRRGVEQAGGGRYEGTAARTEDVTMNYQLLQGDCLTILRTLPAASVHCVVTSPPYFGLRQYLFDKAVVLRYNLSQEERLYVEQELARLGIRPRQ